MRLIVLNNGMITAVDDEDYEALVQWQWSLTPNRKGSGYATRSNGTQTIYMHRVILSAPKGLLVDHIDHNTLNNQRANLRLVTAAENSRHRQKPRAFKDRPTSSRYKGVARNKNTQLWRAAIQVGDKLINLGQFHEEIEAARTYDAAAKEHFGPFAVLNFVGE